MRLKFVDLQSFHHVLQGLAIDVPKCVEVLDSALSRMDKMNGLPRRIIAWNASPPERRREIPNGGREVIVALSQLHHPERGMIYLSQVLERKVSCPRAPSVHVLMQSPSLDIPMRAEIPLRAVLKGGRSLRGTHSVYLHSLAADSGATFVYYGITRRGWNLRLGEHMGSAFGGSMRLFPAKLRELIEARLEQRAGRPPSGPALVGMGSTLCAVGLDEDAAMDVEEYLVDKYSLASKFRLGLNMIPGGHEGIRSLHQLALGSGAMIVETEDREQLLDDYLRANPALGRPKHGVAQAWNNPAYAEAVICGRENRLEADQVRRIRYLSALGKDVASIRLEVGAIDEGQVARVLSGRTYSRIR